MRIDEIFFVEYSQLELRQERFLGEACFFNISGVQQVELDMKPIGVRDIEPNWCALHCS